MKTITKLFTMATVVCTTLLSVNAKAQTMNMSNGMAFKIGVGVSGGVTTENSPFSYGLGADVRLQYDLSKSVSLTASGGYTRLFAKDNIPALADYDFIPAIGGVKVFPIERMYLMAEVGAGFGIQDGSKTSFIFGGGLGYEWNSGFDLGVKYQGYQQDGTSTTYQPVNGQFALRLGYNF
ncbi:outer membrane beta-barrel protein [Pedobacter boryungensis]|uniref:Outer membrane protein beta-barrel domain-containing protein n=1 Tax=Pedobacter boryungensis TaxID=869962 RepID=A0ABX2D9I9_9SPHI|nr:outer membrane beta-barrel protein [Pedobacter boryungensis]NQX30721.1 hypothetical protein [Pedobacter boryungensis]